MPSKAEKLLEQMRRNRAGWKRADFDRLYLGFGFIISPGGSHDKVKHPDFPQLRDTLPRHPGQELGKHYATYAVNLIDKLKQLQKEKKSKESSDE